MINNAAEFARKAIEIASEYQGVEILLLDMKSITDFADFFVIMTGENKRHIDALSNSIASSVKNSTFKLNNREGNSESGWILLDYGDIIIHIFGTEEREFFQLEKLWENAKARSVDHHSPFEEQDSLIGNDLSHGFLQISILHLDGALGDR